MKNNQLTFVFTVFCAGVFSGCQSTPSTAPPVSAAMVQSGAGQHVDMATLTAGRTLFVGRCARCHALPAVSAHSVTEWQGIVTHMAKRSGLGPEQSEAVFSYIIAARNQ